MRFRASFLTVLAISILPLTTPALASDDGSETALSPIERALEGPPATRLSDDQMEELHGIRMKYDESSSVRRAERHTLHKKLMDELTQPSVDRTAVKALQEKISLLATAEANDRLEMMIEIHEMLSSQQRKNLRADFIAMDSHLNRTHQQSGLLALMMPAPPPGPRRSALHIKNPMVMPSCRLAPRQ